MHNILFQLWPQPFIIAVDSETIDPHKYRITEKYRLNILNLDVADESQYTCAFSAQSSRAALTVIGKHSFYFKTCK